jgi:uncharacterized protein (TIGR02284 family)
MADRDERSLLNHLIEMCRDEARTLRFAAAHVEDPAVHATFEQLAADRVQFADDLLRHAQRLGGADAHDGTTRGALHQQWLAFRHALVGSSEQTMIAEAANVERQTLVSFEHALADLLPPTARDLVEQQCAQLRQGHQRVRSLQAQ